MTYWAAFANNDLGKLEDLTESLILDLRSKEQFDWQQEALVRLGYAVLIDAIVGCKRDKEVEKQQLENKAKTQKQTQKARALI